MEEYSEVRLQLRFRDKGVRSKGDFRLVEAEIQGASSYQNLVGFFTIIICCNHTHSYTNQI